MLHFLNDRMGTHVELAFEKRAFFQRKGGGTDVAEQHGLPGSNFLQGELNNARLVSLGLYHGHVAAFRAVYAACERRLECFYERAESIAALPSERRDAELATLAGDG